MSSLQMKRREAGLNFVQEQEARSSDKNVTRGGERHLWGCGREKCPGDSLQNPGHFRLLVSQWEFQFSFLNIFQGVRLRNWSFCRSAQRPGLLCLHFFVCPVTVTSD